MTTTLYQELGFEVYPQDLEGFYTWDEAVKVSEALGDGWRLPTKDELDLMCLKQEDIGGLGANYYWSSSEFNAPNAWYQNFYSGTQNCRGKYLLFRVRPVRDFKTKQGRQNKMMTQEDRINRLRAEVSDRGRDIDNLLERIAAQDLEIQALKGGNGARTPDCSSDKLFEWELVDNYPDEGTSRAKVPGGWIVVHHFESSESMVFVPDPDHIWMINKEEK